MRTLKRTYKTFESFYRHYNNQLTIQKFFGERQRYHNGNIIKMELPEAEIKRIAEIVAKSIYPSIWKERAWALAAGRGDLSYFQCFYIEIYNGKICVSNSLSGDAYDYCKRMYSRSI